MQARFWCFTLNNPENLLPFEIWPDWVTYCVYQYEVGENGTYHFQGYLECSRTKRLGALQGLDGLDGAHWERRGGSQEQAIAYCSKEDTRADGPWTFGVPTRGEAFWPFDSEEEEWYFGVPIDDWGDDDDSVIDLYEHLAVLQRRREE